MVLNLYSLHPFNPTRGLLFFCVCHPLCFCGIISICTCLFFFFFTPYGSLSLSKTSAVTLINILRDGQGEPESHSETTPVQLQHYPIQSQRIVLLGQNQQRCSKKSLKTSAQTNKPPSLIRSTVAPPIRSEVWSNDTPTPLLDNTQTSPEPSVLSENSNSFLDGYTGTEPLIGEHR